MHVQRGFRMSKSYAEQVMRDHCSITWVVKGETIRDTTDEERFALRAEQAQQAKLREPLGYAEIPGLKFDPPTTGIAATRRENRLVWMAHEFLLRAA
jgi:hypothetical protein